MRCISLFSRFCVAVAATLATTSLHAISIDVGTQVFGDHFTGATLNASNWNTTGNSGGSVTMDGISSVLIDSGAGNTTFTHINLVPALNFGAPGTDWWGQISFKMPTTVAQWSSTITRAYVLLQGQQQSNLGDQGDATGFDLRLLRNTVSTFSLGWGGFDNSILPNTVLIDNNGGSGYAFSDTQTYVASVHRKSDNTVDIYFDSTSGNGSQSNLISNQPLIAGANPVGLTIGDWSTQVAGLIAVDAVEVGFLVPEPSTLTILGIGMCGMLRFGRRRQK